MTHDNNALLNRIAPNGVSADYNVEMMKVGGFFPNQQQSMLPSINGLEKGLGYSNSK